MLRGGKKKKGVKMCHKLAEKWKKRDARRILGEGKEKQESPGKLGGLAGVCRSHSLLIIFFSSSVGLQRKKRSGGKQRGNREKQHLSKPASVVQKSTCCF